MLLNHSYKYRNFYRNFLSEEPFLQLHFAVKVKRKNYYHEEMLYCPRKRLNRLKKLIKCLNQFHLYGNDWEPPTGEKVSWLWTKWASYEG